MAKVFLKETDGGSVIDNSITLGSGANVYGYTLGGEYVTIQENVTGVTVDAHVEKVTINELMTDLKFAANGNIVSIYRADGTTLITTVVVQDDTTGTLFDYYSSGTTLASVSSTDMAFEIVPTDTGFNVTLNGQVLTTAAAAISNYVASGATLTLTAAEASQEVAITGAGNTTVTASTSDDTFSIFTLGTNSITGGLGLDTITLGDGTGVDTVVVGGGVAGTTETHALTFQNLIAGQSVTVDGLTLTATDAIAAADVAAGFASLDNTAATEGSAVTNGVWSGAKSTAWTSGAVDTATVTFTSATADTNVTDIVVTSAGITGVAAPTAVSGTPTQGDVAVTETHALTFQDLIAGQSVTVDGLTLTATDAIAAADVAAGFASLDNTAATEGSAVTNGVWSGAKSTAWTSGAVDTATVTFTSATADTNVTDIVVTSAGITGVAAPTAVSGTPTQGDVAVTETHALTFQDLIAGQSVTVDGLTLTATDAIAAADVAAGFASLDNTAATEGSAVTNGVWSGAKSTAWTSGAVDTATVTFTSATADTNVTDIVVTSAGITGVAAPTAVGAAPTQGSAGTASDAAPSTTALESIINFDIATDELDLGYGTALLATSADTGIASITTGVVTFEASVITIEAMLTAVFTELADSNNTAAFVYSGNTYVVQGDGVAGMQDSDIMLQLTGVTDLTDLSGILV